MEKNTMKKQLLQFFALALLITGLMTAVNIEAQTRPYRVSDRQVQNLLNRIETKTDSYKNALDTALDNSSLNGTDREDNINAFVSDFEEATDDLRERFNNRSSVGNDVQEVLNRAAYIDRFMTNNPLNTATQRTWRNLRNDLSRLSGYYNVSFNLNVQPINNENTGYRGSERDMRNLLTQLEQRTDAYRNEMQNALDRSYLNNTRSEATISAYITDFENATDKLKQNFDARRATSADVQEVLSRANFLDGVMRDYRFTANAENQWRLISSDLSKLSGYYNISTKYNQPYSPITEFDARLTGTYRLNTSQSDTVNDVVDRAMGSYQANQRTNLSRNLQRRLASPEYLAIEKRNQQVTIASSNSPQVTFDANGVARTETTSNGRSIRVTATNNYDGVALSYEGDRVNDFFVNFIPQSNGQLRIVRRVYLENRNETITVASVYDKTDQVARFSDVDNNNNNNQDTGGLSNEFIIPNNTRLTAVLRTPISTKTSQNGDRFRMEITSPSQFDGAIIEGQISKTERSGQVTGRANISLDFDTIRLRNGKTYKFAGIVDEVTMANGDKVSVSNEGNVQDGSRTTKTVTRAGIGAAIGAIIGAIAGGGEGAAIGAGIGAGAGTGSVILQGRDDIELSDGSQFMITATAPNNVGINQ